ncbi:hypothetical protein BH23GEM6_BH23GEM6_05630 [soil metagenome]
MSLWDRAAIRFLGRPLPLPRGLPPQTLPNGVRLVSGSVIPRLGGFFARMAGPAAAVTLGRFIVVHPDIRLSPRLLAHELEHVRQWQSDSLFPLRYALATLRHGYDQNPYEIAARTAETSLNHPSTAEDLS